MTNFLKKGALVLTGALITGSSAFAGDLSTGVSFDTTELFTIGGMVCTALAAVWAIRKAISLINRA